MKKEKGSILLLFSTNDALEGICIDGATEKQTETLQNFLREHFRGKQIIKISQPPDPEERQFGRMD